MAILTSINQMENHSVWKIHEFEHTDHNTTKWIAFEMGITSELFVQEYKAYTLGPSLFLDDRVVLDWEFGMPQELIDLFQYYKPISS